MNVIFTVFSVVLISFLFVHLIKMIVDVPSVVVLIIMGLSFGFPGIEELLLGPYEEFIYFLGNLGLFSLMFLAGLESSWKNLKKEEKDSFYVAFFAAVVPFILGFAVFVLIGYSLITSFVVGVCMSITAEATKAKVLLEIGKLKSRVGSAMIGAGIIDDVFGLLMFSFVIFFLGVASFEEHLVLAGVLVSFAIGIFAQKYFRKHHMVKKTEVFMNVFLVPFFFVTMGMHFDLFSLHGLSFVLFLVIALAIVGKIVGTLISKSHVNFSFKQLYLIGWGMNSRGALELAFALIAFQAGLITAGLYSSLVIMALITTLIFPFIMVRMVRHNRGIMN